MKEAQGKKLGLQTSLKKHWFIYLLVLPGLLYVLLFRYVPMYGILIAFQDYRPRRGVLGSDFVGFKHFINLFSDPYFFKVIWNTFIINVYGIVFGFTFTIFLALMLNELMSSKLKRVLQTLVYLPNFLSWIIFGGIIILFLSPSEGLVNGIIKAFGGKETYFLIEQDYFRTIVTVTNIIKNAGFGTIIYLAALASVDQQQYESATIDGANRRHMMLHITLPAIYPTIAVMLLMNLAGIFSANFEHIYTLYNPLVYETGDVIPTYLYRMGLEKGEYEISTAVSLVFNIIGLITLVIANKIIKKMNVVGIV
ncbi:ABC transporter permease [Paenibacillus mendelii]|uniref:ABC transporter permease n=1 Tax=Paenibacillus mendelii TaxID=206163 RepID=A0ABV6JG52_9BACL|nr:ABC transporter permease subunit [Paenibacillus mendelii]MCQ6557654.1 ABC transporter permease subunit [Paenibacillus mendelii]